MDAEQRGGPLHRYPRVFRMAEQVSDIRTETLALLQFVGRYNNVWRAAYLGTWRNFAV